MRKTVLITGASSGIGFELSLLFAKEGYDLYLTANKNVNLQNAANEIHQLFPEIAIRTIAKDLSANSSPVEIYNIIKEDGVFIDVLVNNAGTQVYGKIQETDIQKQFDLLHVNLIAMTHLTMLFLKDMTVANRGQILNVASTGAFAPAPFNAVYCAAKAYVLHFSEGIRCDLKGTGISVTCLCPGATKTSFKPKAHMQDVRLFQRFLSAPDKVAQQGFEGLKHNKAIVIPGLFNKLLVFSIRFTPRSIVRLTGRYLMDKK
jgi:short-subunit dehydrogenase